MFKKITTLFLAVVIFTTASSISIFGQAKSSDENQTVSQDAETKKDELKEVFTKIDNQSATSNFDKKETMADYNKQKAQGQKFSKTTKIVIVVAAVAATVLIIGLVRYGKNEQVFR